ncbi:MAG TPA: DUF2061 domain-containing protein [Chitinophagaceae bacterium]
MILETFVPKKFKEYPAKKEKKGINGRDHLLSFLKGVSWRAVGTIDTIIISYFVTGKIHLALSIGSIEIFTKIALFYFHDRIWELARARKNNIQNG